MMNQKPALTENIQVMPNRQIYRIGELFSGAGGMSLGASFAELDGNRFCHVWINDSDKDACRTFQHNMPIKDESVYCCDVRDLNLETMSPIDGLVFGFPCNDFSIVGEQLGILGKFGSLYLCGVHALKEHQPLFFVAENVGGLASSGEAFAIILRALKDVGYTVSHQKYRFEEYGVPQARHRIIIVGFRHDLNITFQHPEPTSKNVPITSREALSDIKPDAPNHERTRQSKTVVERLKHIAPGENAFTADIPQHLRLAMKSKATISLIYRRLKPDEPAYTVTGSGGGGYTSLPLE